MAGVALTHLLGFRFSSRCRLNLFLWTRFSRLLLRNARLWFGRFQNVCDLNFIPDFADSAIFGGI
jgi:hypothetical protein